MPSEVLNNSMGSPYLFQFPKLTIEQEESILADLFEQLLIFDRITLTMTQLRGLQMGGRFDTLNLNRIVIYLSNRCVGSPKIGSTLTNKISCVFGLITFSAVSQVFLANFNFNS